MSWTECMQAGLGSSGCVRASTAPGCGAGSPPTARGDLWGEEVNALLPLLPPPHPSLSLPRGQVNVGLCLTHGTLILQMSSHSALQPDVTLFVHLVGDGSTSTHCPCSDHPDGLQRAREGPQGAAVGDAESSGDDGSGHSHWHCCDLSPHGDSFNRHSERQVQEAAAMAAFGRAQRALMRAHRSSSHPFSLPTPSFVCWLICFFAPWGSVGPETSGVAKYTHTSGRPSSCSLGCALTALGSPASHRVSHVTVDPALNGPDFHCPPREPSAAFGGLGRRLGCSAAEHFPSGSLEAYLGVTGSQQAGKPALPSTRKSSAL